MESLVLIVLATRSFALVKVNTIIVFFQEDLKDVLLELLNMILLNFVDQHVLN